MIRPCEPGGISRRKRSALTSSTRRTGRGAGPGGAGGAAATGRPGRHALAGLAQRRVLAGGARADRSHPADRVGANEDHLQRVRRTGLGHRLLIGLAEAPRAEVEQPARSHDVTVPSRLRRSMPEDRASAVERLRLIRGVRWQWRSTAPRGARRSPAIGVIAQEVEQVFPELVSTDRGRQQRPRRPGYRGGPRAGRPRQGAGGRAG